MDLPEPTGRPPVSAEIVTLIERPRHREPFMGVSEDPGKMLKLGHRVGASTIRQIFKALRILGCPSRSGLVQSQKPRLLAGSRIP